MAYIKDINPNSIDSHQVSPGYLLTFLRWSNRDTYNYKHEKPLAVRKPLVVYNDALQINVTNTKNALTTTASMLLKCGDINYSTAVCPGDFVIINMLDWEEDAERVRNKAVALQPINKFEDGFKGLFKIQSVVKDLVVDPNSGMKQLTVTITAAGFTELNNVIHYNPVLASAFAQDGASMYQTQVGNYFANLLKSKPNCQDIIRALFKILLGQSFKRDKVKEIENYGNTHFCVPTTLGQLLGVPNAKFAVDIHNFIIGIWKDSKGGFSTNDYSGFNPKITANSTNGNFYETGIPIEGNKLVELEDWNMKTAWSILGGYLNQTMNEMYTTYRMSPDGNRVMPTVVVRQKPFTTNHFIAPIGYSVTKFLEIPRWRISPDLLKRLQTSKNEAARYNMVQVFSRTIPGVQEIDQAAQIRMGNYKLDKDDVKRNGLKPYIVTSNFDFPNLKKKNLSAKAWSEIVSDWIIDGHLKESGILIFQGLQAPISVGDNLEFDNIVYHIEAISHIMAITGDKKSFMTRITVSYGMDKRSSKLGPVYANMEHTDSYTNALEDNSFENIIPGIGDTQDIIGRVQGEELNETKQESFTPQHLRKKRSKDD